MFLLFEITFFAALKLLLAGIPESIGVLVFGIGLVGMAVLIRRLMARGETVNTDENSAKESLSQ